MEPTSPTDPASNPQPPRTRSPSQHHYRRTSARAFLPSPPRIANPAPFLVSDQQPGSLPRQPPVNNWTYDSRYTPQVLLPHLLLGPTRCAKDASVLDTHQPTLLLGLHGDDPVSHAALSAACRAAQPRDIAVLSLPVPNNQLLFAHLDAVNDAIASHLAGVQGAKVLLHCETGNDRAPAAAAAHLMASRGVDFHAAMQYVQTARFSSVFEEERRRLLQAYGDLLAARRAVDAASAGEGKRKRVEEDAEMGEGGDWGMEERGRAPFADGMGGVDGMNYN